MPRPRSLALGDLAAAALTVLDRDGADALSMRAVAAELRMSTMALYRYVEDRGQLERLVVDRVLGGIDLATSAQLPWQERVELLATRARDAVSGHPSAVPLLLAHRQDAASSLRWGEALAEVLADAGFDGAVRVTVFRALLAYVTGALGVQYYGALEGPGTETLAALDPERFPHLSATARAALAVTPCEEFHEGLRFLLRGLIA